MKNWLLHCSMNSLFKIFESRRQLQQIKKVSLLGCKQTYIEAFPRVASCLQVYLSATQKPVEQTFQPFCAWVPFHPKQQCIPPNKLEADPQKFDFTQIDFVSCSRRETRAALHRQLPERAAYAGAISARAPSASTRRSACGGGGSRTSSCPPSAASSKHPRKTSWVHPRRPGALARSSRLIATCAGARFPTSPCPSTSRRACESGGRRTINYPPSSANPSRARRTTI